MSTLFLIRHGQARAFEADSDRLTELGEQQARTVGEHLGRSGVRPTRMICGTLVRQRRTAELAGEALAAVGADLPALEQDARWNEYDAPSILGRLAPALAEQDAAFKRLVEDFQANVASADRNRYFQRMFEALMARWYDGEASAEGIEAFADFHRRVETVFREVVDSGQGGTVLVFASGGPIGVCTHLAVGAPQKVALDLNWRIKNGSITEVLFSKGRMTLDAFNATGHLEPALRTYR
jgi:broad specificity phosphatase PhoE